MLHVARVISEVDELRSDWGVDFGSPKINVDQVRTRKDKVISTLSGGLKQLAKREWQVDDDQIDFGAAVPHQRSCIGVRQGCQ